MSDRGRRSQSERPTGLPGLVSPPTGGGPHSVHEDEDSDECPDGEEYYAWRARRARAQGIFRDDRTGRRTKRRSGPGPPAPSQSERPTGLRGLVSPPTGGPHSVHEDEDSDECPDGEEYYAWHARRARLKGIFRDDRTGRRTRRRSGPGPPAPNGRVPFEWDQSNTSAVRMGQHGTNSSASGPSSSNTNSEIALSLAQQSEVTHVTGSTSHNSNLQQERQESDASFRIAAEVPGSSQVRNRRNLLEAELLTAISLASLPQRDEQNQHRRHDDDANQLENVQPAQQSQGISTSLITSHDLNQQKEHQEADTSSTGTQENVATGRQRQQISIMATKFNSSLTGCLKRAGKSFIRCVMSSKVSVADIMKMRLVQLLECCECKRICSPPVHGCKQGHLFCSLCLGKCIATSSGNEVCLNCRVCRNSQSELPNPTCLCGPPRSMTQVNAMLENLTFKCFCGMDVCGKEIRLHQFCIEFQLDQCEVFQGTEGTMFLSEAYMASYCEFCKVEITSVITYVDHLLKEHFGLGRVEPLSTMSVTPSGSENVNDELLMEKEALHKRLYDLPLEINSHIPRKNTNVTGVPDIVVVTINKFSFGEFALHQVRVKDDLWIWCVSFKKRFAHGEFNASDFHVKMKFKVVTETRIYQKTCNTLVYPMGERMDEMMFLELVGRALPDAWTPSFKYELFRTPTATHATLELQIFKSDGKYVRKFSRLYEIKRLEESTNAD